MSDVSDQDVGQPTQDETLAGGGGDTSAGEGEIDLEGAAQEFEVDLEALLAEREQFLDAYRRVAADFDNFRKQAQRRLEDEISRTLGSFVDRLLPVLDAIDAARTHGSEDVEAVAGQLYGFLEKEGLERVHPSGEPFDPNEAEAVMHEPGEGEPRVTEVFRTGYRFKGRVLRPAMVKVSG